MNKKGAFIAVMLAGVMSLGVSMAGCKKKDDETEHRHSYSYVSDGESGHHRVTTCTGHDPISEAITAHVYDGPDDATCNLCDYEREVGDDVVRVTGVSISGSASVQVGKVIELTADVTPATATNKTVVWEITEGSAYAEIESDTGILKGLAVGKVTVKATADGISSVKEITITAAPDGTVPVSYVTLSQTSAELTVGGSDVKLTVTVSPAEATDKSVIWHSDDEGVVTVTDGVLHAVAEGTATITVTTVDGGFHATCAITVITSTSGPSEEVPANSYTVTFISEGVTVDTQTVESGNVVAAPTVTNDGKYFGGWYDNASFSGTAYDFSVGIHENKTFYVKWLALDAKITYSYAGSEAAAFQWLDTNADGASVQYRLSSGGDYINVDKQLIRAVDGNTVRVDVIGLKGGETYDFKITTSAGADITVEQMAINAYDRSGYAHFGYSDGVGAYNDDGTLKENALVIYVTDDNKNDVRDFVYKNTANGLVKEDISAYIKPGKPTSNGKDLGGETYGSIGYILNNRGYESSSERENYGIQKLTFTYGGVAVRILGKVTSDMDATGAPLLTGLTYYAKSGGTNPITGTSYTSGSAVPNGGTVNDNGNMARITNAKNLTIEGVGEDAEIFGWGVHFVSNDNLHKYEGSGKSFEVRNITFSSYPEDAIGMEGTQGTKVDATGSITSGASDAGADLISPVERCWIHNNVFNLGYCKAPAESDKAEGDGSCDFKRGQYYTLSYNYFTDCHKTNLIGSAKTSVTFNVSMHHNWWHNVESRQPLARRANIHYYNNYISGATSYVISARADCYILAEGNYFYGCKNISSVGEGGGVIKAYANTYNGNYGTDISNIVTARDAVVPNNCKFTYRNIDYSSFDTDPTLFYYDAANKKSDCFLEDSVTARRTVMMKAGVMGFGQTVTDINETKPTTALSIPQDGLTVNLAGVSKGSSTVDGIEFTNITGVSSGVVKGKGQIATFTLVERADIFLTTGSIAVLVRSDGTVLADQLTSYTGTLEAGTYVITGGQIAFDGSNSKETSITSLSFQCGVTDEEKVQNVIDYIDDIGVVEFTDICKNKIELAYAAYNALSATLKSQVTNAAKLTSAMISYNSLAAAPVIELINAIGTVNEDSGLAIAAAREAYDLLTSDQRALVTNYALLTAAEKTYEEYEVIGINKQIAALADPSTATTEAAINELLSKYETVHQMYADLGEEQIGDVVGYEKLTTGISALKNALKPYIVKSLIAELPEQTAPDYYTSVGMLKEQFEALDAQQQAMLTAEEKAIYDDAVAKYTDYMSQAKIAIFTEGTKSTLDDAGFTVTGTIGYKSGASFTLNGETYASPMKFQSANTISFVTANKMQLTVYLHSAGSQSLVIDGTTYTATNGFITVVVEEGTHTFGRSSESYICYVELVPAS